MADEGAEPIELSEALVERVVGCLTEIMAPRLLSHNPQAQVATQQKGKEAASKVRSMSTKFFYQGTLW